MIMQLLSNSYAACSVPSEAANLKKGVALRLTISCATVVTFSLPLLQLALSHSIGSTFSPREKALPKAPRVVSGIISPPLLSSALPCPAARFLRQLFGQRELTCREWWTRVSLSELRHEPFNNMVECDDHGNILSM